MQHTRLALLFLASVSAGIITLVACDTDNGTVPIPGGGSSGNGTSSGKSSSGSSADDDTTGDDDTGPQPDDDDASTADADCKTAPKLRTTTNGFFCAFYDGGTSTPDSGGRQNCGNTQACCNPGKDGTTFPPSYCADDDPKGDDAPAACAAGAAGANSNWVETGSSTWECASAENCGQGQVCCATSRPGADAGNYVNVGPLTGTGAPPKQCNAKNLFKVFGTRCADSCKTDKSEIELCSNTGKCSKSSDKCTPVRATGNRDLGACGP